MNRQTAIACALLLAIVAVAPRVTTGQGTTFTARQYKMLGERARPFCQYLFALKRDNKPLPTGDVRLPGAGNGLVYEAGEVLALVAKCDAIVPLMQQLTEPIP